MLCEAHFNWVTQMASEVTYCRTVLVSFTGCPCCFRYLFLLAGGGALALTAMGSFAVLVFIPALCAVVLIYSLGPQEVHRRTFFFQMTWQTLCHLGLHYTEYYLQEPPSTR